MPKKEECLYCSLVSIKSRGLHFWYSATDTPTLPPPQGMLLAYSMSNLVRTLLSLHSALGKPMTKSAVLAVCRILELLKCIQYTFHRQAMSMVDYVALVVNHYELMLLSYLEATSVS